MSREKDPNALIIVLHGPEHGEIASTRDFDADLVRLESLLEDAHRESSLPTESTHVDAVDDFLIRLRRSRFTERE